MAEKDMIIQRKNADGSYTAYYPKTKAKNVTFEDGTTVELHKSLNASTSQRGHVQLSTSTTSTSTSTAATSSAVKAAMDRANQAFQSASDGKTKIATAITGKGVDASSSDTFPVLADKIGQITVGDYSVGDTLSYSDFIYTGEMWTQNMGESGNGRAMAIDNQGYVYVSTNNAKLRKVDKSGELIWEKAFDFDLNYFDVDSQGNIIFTHRRGNSVKKIDTYGTQVWSRYSYNPYGVHVDYNDNIYVGHTNSVEKLSNDGRFITQVDLSSESGDIRHIVTFDDNITYVTSGNQYFSRVNWNNNTAITFNTLETIKGLAVITIDDQKHIVIGKNSYIVAEYESGSSSDNPSLKVRWLYSLPDKSSVYDLKSDNNNLYVTYDGVILKLEAETGLGEWNYINTGGALQYARVICPYNNIIYFCDLSQNLTKCKVGIQLV